MDLIDRYVFEVARHLPYRNGRDVATELHSLLSDSLEQRAELTGRMPDEEMAVELLREFGEPEDVAARYDEPRYLIGPRLYPTFKYVALIIVIVPAVVAVAGNTIGCVVNGCGLHLGRRRESDRKLYPANFRMLGPCSVGIRSDRADHIG